MRDYYVAIVGRPNVGKSTLFNYIAGGKISIVDDKPGVTRDRIIADANWLGYNFKLIDTGGLDLDEEDIINTQMINQINLGIDMAQVIVMVVDVKTGITKQDRDLADLLRKTNKPIILCVNKVDNYQKDVNYIYEFYELGFENIFPVSATNKQGLGDLLDSIVLNLPKIEKEDEVYDTFKIAIIGRPNVGKSSLTNKLLGKERVIVSNIPGTTRDAIDTEIIKNNNKYIFIDTAGLRRKSQIKDNLELFSYFRTEIAIDRADIVIIVIDAVENITKADVTICGMAHNKGKGVLIVVNKWDLIDKDDKTINEYTKKIKNELSYMSYADIIFISALTGKRVENIYEKLDIIRQNQTLRIPTGTLNEVLLNATAMTNVPQDKGKALKLYYITHTGVMPPTFMIFVNNKELFHFSYLRYIENKFRESFSFNGTSIKFIIREKNDKGDA